VSSVTKLVLLRDYILSRVSAQGGYFISPDFTRARMGAIRCGLMPLKAKEDAGHGNWEALFEGAKRKSKGAENFRFGFTPQQARSYMRTAKTPN